MGGRRLSFGGRMIRRRVHLGVGVVRGKGGEELEAELRE